MFSHLVVHPYNSLDTSTRKHTRAEKRIIKHALELQIRASTWALTIDKEAHYVKLISLIIDAEIKHTVLQGNIDTGTTSLFTADHCINVMRQTAHTYHVLYRGVLDELLIKQTRDSSFSG